MRALGRLVLAAHLVFLFDGAILFGASFWGFGGGTFMIVSAVIALLLWGGFAGLTIRAMTLAVPLARGRGETLEASLRWARGLFLAFPVLSILTGIVLAFFAFASCGPLWLSSLYQWAGLAGSVLGFVAFFCLPLVARACAGAGGAGVSLHRWWVPLVTGVSVYGVWGLIWLIAYLVLSGSINESKYPDRRSSPYRLPFPSGEEAWVIQGNNSSYNHNGAQEHAWDFRRHCGTPVIAARAGTVSRTVDTNDGNGTGKPNNLVEVDHGDGSVGRYLHIQKASARVRRGDVVRQGVELAKVGNVGNSLTGHIHFVVEQGGRSIPVTFQDVTDDGGIPRTFGTYTSGNR